MQDGLLLDPQKFEIFEERGSGKQGVLACEKLREHWTPQLEAEMLEAFIRLYYDDLYRESGPVDPVEFEAYWPELKTPADLIPYTGTEVYLYALADAVYGRDKATGDYGSLHVPLCVILKLNCPWEEEHGWAAVFIEETLVKVDIDIVDCVWLDYP